MDKINQSSCVNVAAAESERSGRHKVWKLIDV